MRTRLATVLVLVGAVSLTGCGRSVKRENAMLREENTKLQTTLSEANTQREATETSLSAANAKLQQASVRFKELNTQLEQTKKALSAAQSKYAETTRRFQAKVDSDSKQLSEATIQLATVRENYDKCQADFAAASAANEKANAQIAELAKQVAALSNKSSTTSSSGRQNLPGKASAGVNERDR